MSKWFKCFCMSLLTLKSLCVFTEYRYFSLHLFSMQLKKTLISFLLIFAYSIGFAYELVPHYHVEDGFSVVKNAEMHHHVSIEDRDLDDISHYDHLDDDFLDFLVCIVSHSDHSAHDNVEFVHQGVDLSFDKFSSADFISLISLNEKIHVPYQKTSEVISKPCTAHWLERSESQSRRGPPKNS